MMKSMTGFGRAQAEDKAAGIGFRVEISSINRKQFDLKFVLPPELIQYETEMRQIISEKVSRGALTVRISALSNNAASAQTLNVEAARKLLESAEHLAKECGLAQNLTVADLLAVPGILTADSGDDSGELTAALLAAATKDALAELIRAKEGEGTRLLADIRMRMDLLKAALEQIIPLTAAMPKLMYEKLLARIKEWDFTTVDPDDDRFLRELVFYADKLDVTEEITRLKSHFQHFDQLTASAEPAGRQLDFMVQEIFREINTLGNKASCAEVSPLIVTMKTELEKIREQIQNIE